MRFSVVTILPELIEASLTTGVVGRARTAGVIAVDTVNPRDFTADKHRTVDDTPYGGGPGMVMKAPPVVDAIETVAGPSDAPKARRILMSPGGAPLTQAKVQELSKYPHLVLVCGRYEGIDQRVVDVAIDEEISLGDFVLSGGEIAALAVIDACSRLIPGGLGESSSADDESFSAGLLEYPQYTRPAEFRGLTTPEILSSGNHGAIAAWRRQQSLRRTQQRRADLFSQLIPTDKDIAANPALDVAARTYVALVHYPVTNRNHKIVTSAVTTFDIHDIARSSSTYGLAGYYVVTPVTSQREKVIHVAGMCLEDRDASNRAEALELVRAAASIGDVVDDITRRTGIAPLVVATSARESSFPAAKRHSVNSFLATAGASPQQPVLILFGTGWGLAESMIHDVFHILTPIRSRRAWNHLSVRSAVAVVLDRLFGVQQAPTSSSPVEPA